MADVTVEERETYIYAKFTKDLDDDVIGRSAAIAKPMLAKNPRLNLLIDDTGLRYKDLSAKNKIESLEALKLVNSCPKTAVVIASEDDKLLYYSNFALNFAKNKRIKITHSMDEAIDWVSEVIDEE